jgi:FkbM family methyltransferase
VSHLTDGIVFRRKFDGQHTRQSQKKRRLFRDLFRLAGDNLKLTKSRQLIVFSQDFIGHHINISGFYEYYELSTLFDWLSQGKREVFDGIAVDIGANIGNHALYFSDFFREVHCFEPNPRTFKVLALNAELASNIKCFNVGISDAERIVRMDTPNDNVGAARVSDTAADLREGVTLTLLDTALVTDDRVRLIKVDVEGHEYQALLGGKAYDRAPPSNNPLRAICSGSRWETLQGRRTAVKLWLSQICYAIPTHEKARVW